MVAYLPDPTYKLEVDSTVLSHDTFNVEVVLIENAVSLAKVIFNDYQRKHYIANIDLFADLKVSLRYGSGAWTEKFCGIVEDVAPILDNKGQLVVATAYGQGRALRNTHCNTSYGTESVNPTIDTPTEIWTDIVDNYVEKSFGGAATGYTLDLASSDGGSPTIRHLHNPYITNLSILNQTLLFIQAFRAGSSGHHWMVGTDGQLRVKRINTDIAGWTKWWRKNVAGEVESEADSTLIEGVDFLSYGFSKRARSKDFANKIILSTDLRKPGYDYWTEGQAALWGHTAVQIEVVDDNATFLVGAESIAANCPPGGGGAGFFWFPAAKDAAWDFTKIGSEKTIPTINFYARRNDTLQAFSLILRTDAVDGFSLTRNINNDMASVDEWYHFSFPVGPYYDRKEDLTDRKWTGSGDWANINYMEFALQTAADNRFVYLDDLHFTGKIIREAYNSTSIVANAEHQKIIRMNSAVDDSMKQADITGTAARLAYAELLTAQKTPIIATLETPGIVDLLPGQYMHIHAAKRNSGAFRIDTNFRAKQINWAFKENGFRTVTQITDDLESTFSKGQAELMSAYYKVVFTDPEAQSLRATGIDVLVPRLSVDYP